MGQHVDLVENRWSAGYQERVGRAYQEGGDVKVQTDADHYRAAVLDWDPELRAKDPEAFLSKLTHRLHSDYFFATDLHNDQDCPFAHGEQVPFQPERIADPAVR